MRALIVLLICGSLPAQILSPILGGKKGHANGYSFGRSITINTSQITGTLTNYPMAVAGTYTYLKTVGNGGSVTNANGYDIIFTSDSAGNTPIACEQESYSATTGAVTYWVVVASAATSSVIYMWYGNGSVSTAQCAVTGVWDANESLVVHYPNGSSLSTVDSTGNNTVTNSGASANSTHCIADGCVTFNGSSNYMSAPNTASLEVGTTLTMELWVYLTRCGSSITCNVFIDKRNGGHGYFLGYNYTGVNDVLEYYLSGSTTSCDFYVGTINVGQVIYIAATYDGATMKAYMNGVALSQQGGSCTGTVATGSTNDATATLYIGRLSSGSSNFANGPMDEMRISNSTRSATWISAVFKNLSAPATFYAVGAAM